MASPGAIFAGTRRDTLVVNKDFTRELAPILMTKVAKEVLREEQIAGRFPREKEAYVRIVDGTSRKVEEQVRPGGRIAYVQKARLAEVVAWVYERLYRSSPYTPKSASNKRSKRPWHRRHYIDSHIILKDRKAVIDENLDTGRIVAILNQSGTPKDARRPYAIMNIQPYARRIETGVTRYRIKQKPTRGKWKGLWTSESTYGPPGERIKQPDLEARPYNWTLQAPNGVYRKVVNAANQRWRGVAYIRFRYRQAPGLGYQFTSGGAKINQFYPTLEISPTVGAIEKLRT